MNLNGFLLPLERDRLTTAHHNLQSRRDWTDAMQTRGREWFKNWPEDAVELRPHVGLAVLDLIELLLQRNCGLGQETQAAILLPERDHVVLQHGIDGLFDLVLQGRRRDGRLKEGGNIMRSDRKIFEDLQHSDGLRHVVIERLSREPLCDSLNAFDDV